MKRNTQSLLAAVAAAALAGGAPATSPAAASPSPAPVLDDAPTVMGEIRRAERVSVQDRDHLLVLVGVEAWVDLGPADEIDEPPPQPGQWIRAFGEETADDGRRVVLARSFRIGDGLERNVERPEARIEGAAGAARRVDVAGREHLILVLHPPKPPTATARAATVDLGGDPWLADLGPADRLGIELEPEDRVTVTGAATCVGDARILLARSVTHEGVRVEIDRSRPDDR